MAAALLAAVLGYWGFRTSAATENGGVLDALYRTARLFGLAGGDIDPPVAWPLQIARVLAPLLVGYAAVRGLAALFREQFLLLRLRLFAKDHVVIAGLGDDGFRLATALHDADMAVVAIEQDRQNPALNGCRKRGIPVVIGDATDPEILGQARADRAIHVVGLCGQDGVNLGVVAACVELATAPGWVPARVHAGLENSALWRSLRISALASGSDDRLRIEFFSVTDLAARALVEHAFAGWEPADAERCRIIIDGMGPLGQAAASHAVRIAHANAEAPVLALVRDSDRRALLEAQPSLAGAAEVEVLDFDPLSSALDGEAVKLGQTAFVLVCVEDDPDALAHAAAFAQLARGRVPVVVAVSNERIERSLDTARLRPGSVAAVGARAEVLGPGLLSDTALEAIARAKHEQYLRKELERGSSAETNPSIASWDDLPDNLKDSNRRFADSVGVKVRAIRAVLVPRRPGAPAPEELGLPTPQLEELAREEHERWVRDLRAKGWQPAEAKDAERKLHHLLVPWQELSEAEREKDRDGVRELPALLAAAGFAIVPEPAQGVSPAPSEELAQSRK